ncbi:MAG TPA: YciI family protein [Thermomicrobiales bacterium]|jgi:hypothetical protein|nr:YciI family protein [Thermomicrobiales bacterium]
MAIFAVWAQFTNHEERLKMRPTHRVYLAELLDKGKLVSSGPFKDDTGALLIYEAADEAEVRQLMADDPYATVGAIGSCEIKEWNRVFAQPTEEIRPS